MPEAMYTVACALCPWKEPHPTQAEADAAAEQHEQEHAGHVAYVHRPDLTQEAA